MLKFITGLLYGLLIIKYIINYIITIYSTVIMFIAVDYVILSHDPLNFKIIKVIKVIKKVCFLFYLYGRVVCR